jgi:predicted enzyme related to lactoylglutathione lyase
MARLHQVLALKSLGVPLRRARELLGDALADLDAVLQLQETALRDRMAGDGRKLELLTAVRGQLRHGEALSVDDLINLTRETVMTDPIEGRLAAVRLRVADQRHAAAWFGDLFGWRFAPEPGGGSGLWANTAASVGDHPWDIAITDDTTAPRLRLGFEVADPDETLARARSLGGSGEAPEAAADDQGLALAFLPRRSSAAPDSRRTGEVGVAVALVDDTAKAKAFYGALFGDGFHQIGPQDRWWSTKAAFGIFSSRLGSGFPAHRADGDDPDVHIFVCVSDLAAHQERIRTLGGQVLTEDSMGPYQVSACLDDQGTGFCLWRDPAR